MRLMIFTWEYPPNLNGGMGQHVAGLVPALLAEDPTLEIHVVTPTFQGTQSVQRDDRLSVHRVLVPTPPVDGFFQGMQAGNEVMAQYACALVEELGEVDLLHVHDWLASFAVLAVHGVHGVPLVVTFHATERGRYQGVLYSELSRLIDGAECALARQASCIITCSTAMQQEVQEYFAPATDCQAVIPNGIDSDRFEDLRQRDLAQFRAQYARPDERIIFSVARMVYEKGIDLLVEAAPRVLQQVPEAKFIIGGRGPLLEPLQRRVGDLGLSEKVILTGYLSDLDRDKLYVIADCCVFPSRYEPFGIVALEAMAAGTPVVVSDVGGLGGVVSHRRTGITTYPDNVESLAWGIVRTLQEPQAAVKRASRAREAVRSYLSWHHVAAQTLDIYHRTLSHWAVSASGELEGNRWEAPEAA